MATDRLVIKEEIQTYSSVLFKAVENDGGRDRIVRVYSEMDQIVHLLYSDMELSHALSDTSYSPSQREQLTRSVFASVDPALNAILGVMAARDSMDLLSRVFQTYTQMMDQELNLAIVDVKTAVALDDTLREQIIKKAETDLGKTVILRESIDPSILGGIVMTSGGKSIDASVATQLARARQVLKERTNGGESS